MTEDKQKEKRSLTVPFWYIQREVVRFLLLTPTSSLGTAGLVSVRLSQNSLMLLLEEEKWAENVILGSKILKIATINKPHLGQ